MARLVRPLRAHRVRADEAGARCVSVVYEINPDHDTETALNARSE